MATPLVLRCRTKSGQHQIKDLDSESTILDLKAFILSLTGLDYDKLLLKSGYPPTAIDKGDASLLKDCGIRSGDIIIVEEARGRNPNYPPKIANDNPIAGKRPAATSSSDENQAKRTTDDLCTIKRKVVPANNSCLFVSIDYCREGFIDQKNAPIMRRIVADKILSDSEKYSEALLGRSQKDYVDWILKSSSWGGGIELAILCEHYALEIDVVDVKNTRVEKFGEEHDNRILLIYDGIHYDPLYEESHGSRPRTIFPTRDEGILARALQLAEKEKSNRQFTDTDKFKLKCLVCGQGFSGAVEANEHAKETSHINFGEY